ncbi:MAG TPA: ribokinase [Anaerolineae bacterium]|nr:ribokinase [Anaerolineae bacterium]
MDKNIVVIGSSNTDMIIKMSRIPKPGETVLGGEFSIAAGGKGANQAVSAARAGGKVVFIARVGEDMFGEQAVKGFVQDGIDTENIVRDKNAPSGVALIFVDKDGENSIAVASGANANLSPADIAASRNVIASASIILMQLEIPIETVKAVIEIAREHEAKLILNPAPAQPLGDEILRHISIITPNESEAELLTGIKVMDEQGAERAADALLAKGIQTVLITLGARGVYVADSDFKGIIPGFSVNAEDTTAAGDVFNGVLAVSLAENKSLIEAVRFSNAAAALSVTKLGAQTSAPYREDIEMFLKSF